MDDMKLPAGKTCSDCRSWARCKKFIGSLTGKETTCDWAPSRFEESNESLMRQIEAQKEEIEQLRVGIKRLGDRFHENDPIAPSEFYELADLFLEEGDK